MAVLTDQLVTVTCCVCAVPFGIPQYVERVRRQDELCFFCPMGHKQYFPSGKTEVQLLREQLADVAAARDHEAQQRQAAEAETKRLRAQQRRTKRRQASGVCPCCHRTFTAMARHMAAKHPGYGAP